MTEQSFCEKLVSREIQELRGQLSDRNAEIAKKDKRIEELKEHERQTHERLSAILGTGDSLEALVSKALKELADLKAKLGQARKSLPTLMIAFAPGDCDCETCTALRELNAALSGPPAGGSTPDPICAVYERFKHLDTVLLEAAFDDDPFHQTCAALWLAVKAAVGELNMTTEPWRPGAISEEERAERDKGANQSQHACLNCAAVRDEADMFMADEGWFCDEGCLIMWLGKIKTEIRQDAENHMAEIDTEIRGLCKGRKAREAATLQKEIV